jgi:hypothetical protein
MQAQTYATEELRLLVESDIASKIDKTAHDEKPIEQSPLLTTDNAIVVTKDFYIIEKIEIVNIGSKYSQDDIASFEREADSEFQNNNFMINSKTNEFFITNRDNIDSYKKFKFEVTGNQMKLICETCDFPEITIAENNPESMVLDFPNQDEGKEFMFRFTFKKH